MSGRRQAIRAGNSIVTSLIVPSDAIWRRPASDMATPLAASLPFSPFANVSIPIVTMIGYAEFYLLIALVIAVYHFHVRDL
ncbi:MAG TPA: hypothetical protein VGR36_06130 [Candidatus Acidoferrales bacterium]|nr:hypothetical protein [Candidatus Acidoferrales bacterium]